ncbi:uncharacterized protein C3orf14 homolog [Xyrichtys novacula]|uniref:Uncharacterized protein C3orf14 homolog n=1 Tax=Xyrichtys novacula TaxID=13765 RepID=A0AAV1ESL0_XYRNO|nr:uncharacterized protein C3orf14 homolog [Xyrichtys novacula]
MVTERFTSCVSGCVQTVSTLIVSTSRFRKCLIVLLVMSACSLQELEFIEKYEEILERRSELLEEMKRRREQLKIQKKKQVEEAEAAHKRNMALLQGLQKIEDRLRGRQLPHPDLLALETRYWNSVEESVPAWENFLLGKGPHPTDSPRQLPRRTKQKPSTAQDKGLPPLPKPRTSR